MKEKYGKKGFQVIGIHSPEFDLEKERGRVEAAVKKYRLDYPIMMDNDHTYWRALGNRYWPGFYVVDRGGTIILRAIGEIRANTARGDEFESHIRAALGEPPLKKPERPGSPRTRSGTG